MIFNNFIRKRNNFFSFRSTHGIRKFDFFLNKQNNFTINIKFNNRFFVNNKYNFFKTRFSVFNLSYEERIFDRFTITLIERSVDFLLIKKLNYFYNYKNNLMNNFLINNINNINNTIILKRKYFKNVILNIKHFIYKITNFDVERLTFFNKKQILNFCNKKQKIQKVFGFFFSLIFRKFFHDFIVFNYKIFFFNNLINCFIKNSFFIIKKKNLDKINFFQKRYFFLFLFDNFLTKYSNKKRRQFLSKNCFFISDLNFKNLISFKSLKLTFDESLNTPNTVIRFCQGKLEKFLSKINIKTNFFFDFIKINDLSKICLFFDKKVLIDAFFQKSFLMFKKNEVSFFSKLLVKNKIKYKKKLYNSKFSTLNNYFLKVIQFYIYVYDSLVFFPNYFNGNNFFFEIISFNNIFLSSFFFIYYKVNNTNVFILSYKTRRFFRLMSVFYFLKKNSSILVERVKKEDMNPKTYYKKYFLKEKYKDILFNYYNCLKYKNLFKTKSSLRFVLNKFLQKIQGFFDIFFSKNFDFKINREFSKKNEVINYIKFFFKNFIYSFSSQNRIYFLEYLLTNNFLVNFVNFFSSQYFNLLNINKFFSSDKRYFKKYKFFFKSLSFFFNQNKVNLLNMLLFKNFSLSKVYINKYLNNKIDNLKFFYISSIDLSNNLLNFLKYKKISNYSSNLLKSLYKDFYYFKNKINLYKPKSLLTVGGIHLIFYKKIKNNLFVRNKSFFFQNLIFYFSKQTISNFFFNFKYIFNSFNNKLLRKTFHTYSDFKNELTDNLFFPYVYSNVFWNKNVLNFINGIKIFNQKNLNFKFFSNNFFNPHLKYNFLDFKKIKFHFLFLKKLLLFVLNINHMNFSSVLFIKNKFFSVKFFFKNMVIEPQHDFFFFKNEILKSKLIFDDKDKKIFNYNLNIFLRFLVFKVFVFKFYIFSYYNMMNKFFEFTKKSNKYLASTNFNFQFFFKNNQCENFLLPFMLKIRNNVKRNNLLWLNINITKRNVFVNLFYNKKKPSLFVYTAGQTLFEGKLKKSKEASILIGKKLWKRIVLTSKQFFLENKYFYKNIYLLDNFYSFKNLNFRNTFLKFKLSKRVKNYLINIKFFFYKKIDKKKFILNILNKKKFYLFNKINVISFFKNNRNNINLNLVKIFKTIDISQNFSTILKVKFCYCFFVLNTLLNNCSFFFIKILYFIKTLNYFYIFNNLNLYKTNFNKYKFFQIQKLNNYLLSKTNKLFNFFKNNKFEEKHKKKKCFVFYKKRKYFFLNKKEKSLFFNVRHKKNLKLFFSKILKNYNLTNALSFFYLNKNLFFIKNFLFNSFLKGLKRSYISKKLAKNNELVFRSFSCYFDFKIRLKYLIKLKFFLLLSLLEANKFIFFNKKLKLITFKTNSLKNRIKIPRSLKYKKYKTKFFLFIFKFLKKNKKIYYNNQNFFCLFLNSYINFKNFNYHNKKNFLKNNQISFFFKFLKFGKHEKKEKVFQNLLNIKNLIKNKIYFTYFNYFLLNSFFFKKKNSIFVNKIKFYNYFMYKKKRFNIFKTLSYKKNHQISQCFNLKNLKKLSSNFTFLKFYINRLLKKIIYFWKKLNFFIFQKIKTKILNSRVYFKKILKFLKFYKFFSLFLNKLIFFKNLKNYKIVIPKFLNKNFLKLKFLNYKNNKKNIRLLRIFLSKFKIVEQTFFSNKFYQFITLCNVKKFISRKNYLVLLTFFKKFKFIWVRFLKGYFFIPQNYLNKNFFKNKLIYRGFNYRGFNFIVKKNKIFDLKLLKLIFLSFKETKAFNLENLKKNSFVFSFFQFSKTFKFFKKYIYKVNVYKKIYFKFLRFKVLNFLNFIDFFFNKFSLNTFRLLITKKSFKNIYRKKFFNFLNKFILNFLLPKNVFFFKNFNLNKTNKLLFLKKYFFIKKNIFTNYKRVFFLKNILDKKQLLNFKFLNFFRFNFINYNNFEFYKLRVKNKKLVFFKKRYYFSNKNLLEFKKLIRPVRKFLIKFTFFLDLDILFYFLKFYQYFNKNLKNKKFVKFEYNYRFGQNKERILFNISSIFKKSTSLFNFKNLKFYFKLNILRQKIKFFLNDFINQRKSILKCVNFVFFKFSLKKKLYSYHFLNKLVVHFASKKFSKQFTVKNKFFFFKYLLTFSFLKIYTNLIFKSFILLNNHNLFKSSLFYMKKKRNLFFTRNYYNKKKYYNFEDRFFVPKKGYLLILSQKKNRVVRGIYKGFLQQARGRKLFKRMKPRFVKVKKFVFTKSRRVKGRRK